MKVIVFVVLIACFSACSPKKKPEYNYKIFIDLNSGFGANIVEEMPNGSLRAKMCDTCNVMVFPSCGYKFYKKLR